MYRTIWVLIFCVEFWALSHLTCDLFQAEKKMNVHSYKLSNWQNDYFHSKWQLWQFWVKQMLFCAFDKLATPFIFFSAWSKSHVKWDNSKNLTQKMRTWLDQGFRCNKRCKCNFLVCMFAYHKHFQCTYITYWVKILFEGSFGEKVFSTKNSRNNVRIPLLYVEMWDPWHPFWGGHSLEEQIY